MTRFEGVEEGTVANLEQEIEKLEAAKKVLEQAANSTLALLDCLIIDAREMREMWVKVLAIVREKNE